MRTFGRSIPFYANALPAAPPAGSFRADYRGTVRMPDDTSGLLTALPIGPEAERDVVYVFACQSIGDTTASRSATLGGVSGTELAFIRVDSGLGRLAEVSLWEFLTVTGTTANFQLTVGAGSINFLAGHAVSALDVVSTNIVTSQNASVATLSQSIINEDEVFAAVKMFNGFSSPYLEAGNLTPVGVTELYDSRSREGSGAGATALGQHTATGTESPRVITFTDPDPDVGISGISLRLRG